MNQSSMARAALRLTLVRHGETVGESSIRYHGRTDVRLSALGRTQMEQVHLALAAQRFAAVYSSTLSRSSEAARIICAGNSEAPMVTPLSGFDEVDFGEWEGLTAAEICSLSPALYAEWQMQGGNFVYPGGESGVAFQARVARTLRQVLADTPRGELLFVLHKGVIRCIVTELLGPALANRGTLSAALGSIHILVCEGGAWRAEALDLVAHLS